MTEELRVVKYTRCDYGSLDKPCEAPLLLFIYDIPYFASCDVLPPLHIMNETFESGGQQGGMGPGATWSPFSITKLEYEDLVTEVKTTSIEKIRAHSRFAHVPFIIDPAFDHIQDRLDWSREICRKYGAQWMRRVNPEVYGEMDDDSLSKIIETMTKETPNKVARPDR